MTDGELTRFFGGALVITSAINLFVLYRRRRLSLRLQKGLLVVSTLFAVAAVVLLFARAG